MSKIKRRISYIPNDIVLEILPRLPVKSLLRFCCVAKSWNSLITSHDFSKTNLHYLNKKSNFEYRLMVRNLVGDMKHFSLGKGLHEPLVHVFDTKNQFRIGCNFVGSCNGLICMAVIDEDNQICTRIVLWNPSIQKTKLLPDFGLELDIETRVVYGFGYDESRDDYKVVAIYFSINLDILAKIYSLKTGEFKRMKSYEGHIPIPYYPPTFANGKIHWFEQSPEYNAKCFIAYLDLSTEEYGKIKMPEFSKLVLADHTMMARPGGSLYVSCYTIDNNTRYVWLLEPGYGVGDTTWNEVIRYTACGHQLEKYFKHNKIPLFVLKKDEIVSFSEGKIVVFNLKDCSARYPRLSCHQGFRWGIAYVETLVSPLNLSS